MSAAPRSDASLPDDVLLCIFDQFLPAKPMDPQVQKSQATFNALALVSRDMHALVSTVRYKHIKLRTVTAARLLLDQPNPDVSAAIASQLRTINLGRDISAGRPMVTDTVFEEVLAAYGGGQSKLEAVSAQGIRLNPTFFWAIKKSKSRMLP